jgi:spore maturation protein A
MIKYIWGMFIIVGIVYGFISGNIIEINDTILSSTSSSIDMILKLLPMMCLWLGIMNIAKDSGLLNIISKKLSFILRIIFPDIPEYNSSLSLIASNITMNILGLGNAATPFGLKTMKALQELNDNKEVASRSMITFLVINTASITLIPTTIISIRLLHNSSNPSEIIIPSIITSFISLSFGLLLDRFIYKVSRRRK